MPLGSLYFKTTPGFDGGIWPGFLATAVSLSMKESPKCSRWAHPLWEMGWCCGTPGDHYSHFVLSTFLMDALSTVFHVGTCDH